MSASDLLRRLDEETPRNSCTIRQGCLLRTLLPELRAVVEAADVACESVWAKDHVPLRAALDALDSRAAELGGTDG